FARQLAANGLHLVLVARRLPLLEALGKQLEDAYGIHYRAVGLDLTKEDFMQPLEEATHDLDIGLVISNAGSGGPEEFLATEHHQLRQVVQLNAIAHLDLTHYYGRRMAQRGRGGILLVSTLGARQAVPYTANLAAAKAYVLSLGAALHVEFQPVGVRVTVLLPGPTDTPVIDDFGYDQVNFPMRLMSPEQCAAEGLAALQMNRATHVPGRMNRIQAAVLPRSVVSSMFGKMMRQVVVKRGSSAETPVHRGSERQASRLR
ncbi:MAG TPA: SDR family NAD(P)-dependent oxidoreductase, partial [Chloroflexota bacterium]